MGERYTRSGKLAHLAILVSGGVVLQILACALYDNGWPMMTVIMYVLLPMPLLFFAGSNSSSLFSESDSPWVNANKFLTGFSAVGGIAIWLGRALELSSFFVLMISILCFLGVGNETTTAYSKAGRSLPVAGNQFLR